MPLCMCVYVYIDTYIFWSTETWTNTTIPIFDF